VLDRSSETSYAEAIVETITQPLLVLDAELRVETANPAFLRQFEVAPEATLGRPVYELGNGQWDIPELRRLLEEVLSKEGHVEGYRVEHEFETIGERIMLLNAHRMRRANAPDLILLAISDVTERGRLLFELEGHKEFAGKLIDSVREALIVLGWDLRVHFANKSFYDTFKVAPEDTRGRLVYELGNGQWDIPELRRLLEDILPRENSFDDFEVEHAFEQIGRRVMLLNARRLDHLDLILLAIRDVTEERQAAGRQKALTGELQHRVKNILNSVSALASQTRRRSRTLDEFMAAFEARLGALGRTQDLIVRSPLETAGLHELARLELEAVGAHEGKNFIVEGPTVRLSPHDAQAMAMAIHELTTNAAKYGALSAAGGTIAITWRVERRNDRPHLSFHWREHGVRIASTDPTRGFGSQVIEKSLPYMLGGTAELTFKADGVGCRLEFSLPG
jgi:PAS domain S-box-containing protein